MSRKADFVRKKYAPLLDKNLQNALARRIGTEFPRIGGPRILAACAELVLEVVFEHLKAREHLGHGQILWMAVSVDDPPSRGKTIAETDMKPVILDLSVPEDIEARLERISPTLRLSRKAIRLCHQAFEQQALLSNCDLAEILSVSDGRVSNILTAHERKTGNVIPRRATIHDVGTGLTHKHIICHKRYLDGTSPPAVARATYHSLEAVDRYLAQYDRVRHCRLEGMSLAQTAYTLNCSLSLVEEHLAIDKEMEQGGMNERGDEK